MGPQLFLCNVKIIIKIMFLSKPCVLNFSNVDLKQFSSVFNL